MVTLRVLKLGTKCRDRATGLEGTLTHWFLNMGQEITYLFQPKLLDENGQPVKKLVVVEERLEINGDQDFEQVEIPFEILGTTVTNESSGFTGMGVEFIRHINGCFHVVIQPEGVVPGKNTPIKQCDFDLRECVGEYVPQLSEVELAESKVERPSPTGDAFDRESRFTSSLPGRAFSDE